MDEDERLERFYLAVFKEKRGRWKRAVWKANKERYGKTPWDLAKEWGRDWRRRAD